MCWPVHRRFVERQLLPLVQLTLLPVLCECLLDLSAVRCDSVKCCFTINASERERERESGCVIKYVNASMFKAKINTRK